MTTDILQIKVQFYQLEEKVAVQKIKIDNISEPKL
jgi:hypothetical protein